MSNILLVFIYSSRFLLILSIDISLFFSLNKTLLTTFEESIISCIQNLKYHLTWNYEINDIHLYYYKYNKDFH
jgi:hypothetical protein